MAYVIVYFNDGAGDGGGFQQWPWLSITIMMEMVMAVVINNGRGYQKL